MKHRLTLLGCAPVPLAHYLKALGVLRIVGEQVDDRSTGHWWRDQFVLESELDREALIDFFLNRYAPAPIVAPWNSGSGFFPQDNAKALEAIEKSEIDRFQNYREVIKHARLALMFDDFGFEKHFVGYRKLSETFKNEQNSETKETLKKALKANLQKVKEPLLQLCRNTFPDHALKWIDAVYVLTEAGEAKYPPLIGTGGNDGRLEFTNNFMQRLIELIDLDSGVPKSGQRAVLSQALFASAAPPTLTKAPIGQFFPGAAGGANAASGFSGTSMVNQWDFVLMLEGAMVFAAASVKRLEDRSSGKLAYPFCVRQSSAGYASASGSDESDSRAEIWMPLWSEPTTLEEVLTVFGEGRAQVGRRAARTGVDFARAAVTIGVDRGIGEFQRYGFQRRNGKAYFATPLDRVEVKPNSTVDLLAQVDSWLSKLRDKARPKKDSASTRRKEPTAPASITRALRHIESRILDLCKNGTAERLQNVLIALGQCERTLTNSLQWTLKMGIPPLAGSLSTDWLREADTGSQEFRLARSLASLSTLFGKDRVAFIRHLEPLKPKKKGFCWNDQHDPDVRWSRKNLAANLNEVLSRQLVKIAQAGAGEFPPVRSLPVSLHDVVAFIEERVDEVLMEDLLWGLVLIDYRQTDNRKEEDARLRRDDGQASKRSLPPAIYSLMKLCFLPANLPDNIALEPKIPIQPQIHRQAAFAANSAEASALAARRLLASGHPPLIRQLTGSREVTIRSAAALLFPINFSSVRAIIKHVLPPKEEDE